jgi:cytochrome c oxidase subunit 2
LHSGRAPVRQFAVNPTALAIAISYSAVCLLAVVFLLVIWRSTHARRERRERGDDDVDTARLAHGEKIWFVIAVAALGVLLLATIPFTPYGQGSATADEQRVEVNGAQFAWITDPNTLEAGRPVRFAVTASDVNHGFGVYNDDDVMLLQVQAVPDHTTEVTYTFKVPGTYQIVCLEFCGVNHHNMIGTFEVAPS